MASSAIDQLRTLLDHLDGAERSQQLEFFRTLLAVGPAAVEELSGRLPGVRAPRPLRQLSMEASFYFPWPDWVPILARLLRYESDYALFETGTRALGRVATEEALEALRELNSIRQEARFKEVLATVLTETDPREAFNLYLSRLMEGSGNPAVANEAAQRLSRLVDGNCLEPLKQVAMHPDLLVFRHALQLIANIFTPEAAETLVEAFQDNHEEVLADRVLKEALASVRALPPAGAREAAEAALKAVAADPGDPYAALLTELYTSVLAATEEGKPSQLGALVAQVADRMHLRSRRLSFALDACAEGLAGMAARGLVDPTRVLDLLEASYEHQTGREGVARAMARLVPADAGEIHRLLLGGPDGAQRAAAVEILGGRREAALEPVLLLACRDSLTDIADRALFHLGQLPGAEALAKTLLHSGAADDVTLGLRLAGEHRFVGLVPDLLEMIKNATREDVALQAIETLGAVGAAQAAEPLLELLHSGQSPKLQLILAQALRGLQQPEVALALCAKADELRMPALHALALEAVAETHASLERPLPPEWGPRVLDQVRRAWMERNPWALRLRVGLALPALQLDHGETWLALAELLHETLAEKRPPGVWTPDELHQLQANGREFFRRSAAVKVPV